MELLLDSSKNSEFKTWPWELNQELSEAWSFVQTPELNTHTAVCAVSEFSLPSLHPGARFSWEDESNTFIQEKNNPAKSFSSKLKVGLDFDVSEILNKPPFCQNLLWPFRSVSGMLLLPQEDAVVLKTFGTTAHLCSSLPGLRPDRGTATSPQRDVKMFCAGCVCSPDQLQVKADLTRQYSRCGLDFSWQLKIPRMFDLERIVPHLTWINIVQIMVDSWRASDEEMVEMFTFARLHRLPQPCCPKAEGLPLTDFAQTPEDKKKINVFL